MGGNSRKRLAFYTRYSWTLHSAGFPLASGRAQRQKNVVVVVVWAATRWEELEKPMPKWEEGNLGECNGLGFPNGCLPPIQMQDCNQTGS